MDNQDRVNRGISAARLLDDPLLLEAFSTREDMYINDWKSSKVDETVKRDTAYMSLRALDDLKSALQSIVDTGKIAGRHLERDQKL